eukprot:jgi/Mesen1/8331/ME000046S07721
MATMSKEKEEEALVKEGPTEKFLRDYAPPDFAFDSVALKFALGEEHTTVHSTIDVRPLLDDARPLVLNGEELVLESVHINGAPVPESEYKRSERTLVLLKPPTEPFQLEIETRIQPQNNTSLEGLYKSSTGNFCSQCEAEGFRKITFFQDRPDVMAKYSVRIEADKHAYPVLLSNGNLTQQGDLPEGRHFVVWEDPWPKPSYLFALVAGQLACSEDTFTTVSGRKVTLRIYVQEADLAKTHYAMRSLKASMTWDEEVFGLEYDLDLFNIVAVPDFNMGAMENKSLNIFNSRLVLATPETATDADYTSIEGVIAHEYFHNWTGNRVTCRDWFQLSLKEGLTVYRDQEFSADMNSRAVVRIGDVMRLRSSQFSQDAGPMAHPVRPQSYIKVYEKGAEVVRMYETLLGKPGFRRGMDLYFARHDGHAVTCDDFLAAMRDANNANLSIFGRWLAQAGTPVLTVRSSYNEQAHTFTLHTTQEVPPTPGQPHKLPMLLPLRVGLLNSQGRDMELSAVYDGDSLQLISSPEGTPCTSVVLRVEKAEQEFTFVDVMEKPVPSLLRGFSAPVRLVTDLSPQDLQFLLAHDSDEFNRWEAGQTLARTMMLGLIRDQQEGRALSMDAAYVQALRSLLSDTSLDDAFVAKVLVLPSEGELADLQDDVADPDAIHAVHHFCKVELASQLRPELSSLVESRRSREAYSPDHGSKARRSLKNTALMYLAALDDEQTTQLAVQEFKEATNMTEQLAALAALAQNAGPARDDAFSVFYEQWKHDSLVMNKWLGLQASSSLPGNVYALLGGFCACPVNFHAADGSGYQLLADSVLRLDRLNAQVAARMVSAFTRWRKYDLARQALAKAQLERIVASKGLSDNVYEIAHRSLAS